MELNESQKKVFTKMCDMVNVKIEIRTNNNIRKELTTLPYRPTKKRVEKTVMWFNLMWGWKTKQ